MKFPAIPLPTKDNLQLVAQRVKLILDQMTGASGGNRAVTFDDLSGGEVVDTLNNSGVGTNAGANDTSPPPAPLNVTCTAGFGTFTIHWDVPLSFANRLSFAEVWGGPTNVIGNAIRLGTSTSNFFIDRGSLGDTKFFWVRLVSKANIAGPFHDTNPVSGTLGKIGNADLAPLAVQAAQLAEGAVDLTSNKVKASTNFGAIAVGYTVTQYLLVSQGFMQNLVVDDAQVANLSAAKLTAGDGTIGGILKSANFADGVDGITGWRLEPNGDIRTPGFRLIGNVATFSGSLQAATGHFNGRVTGGSFTQYAWPPAGQTGFYLGPEGLLIGNANNGRYVQIEASGNFFMPGLSVTNGNAVFSGSLSASVVFAGTFSGASGTFGTITSGFLRNPSGTSFLNLNAVGSQPFLSANVGAARITADGDAFFLKTVASGVWNGAISLIPSPIMVSTTDANGNTVFTDVAHQYIEFFLDTGFNKPHSQFFERSMTARIGAVGIAYAPAEANGNYIGNVAFEAHVVLQKPMFAGSVEGPGQNPFGSGSERVLLRIRAQILDRDGKTQYTLTSFSWTLDAVA